jgi:hypothetical protein
MLQLGMTLPVSRPTAGASGGATTAIQHSLPGPPAGTTMGENAPKAASAGADELYFRSRARRAERRGVIIAACGREGFASFHAMLVNGNGRKMAAYCDICCQGVDYVMANVWNRFLQGFKFRGSPESLFG